MNLKSFRCKVPAGFLLLDWDDKENAQIDIEQWETNWDDEIIESDFAEQLQAEIQKSQQQHQQSTSGAPTTPVQ
jgi:hypothetical protein